MLGNVTALDAWLMVVGHWGDTQLLTLLTNNQPVMDNHNQLFMVHHNQLFTNDRLYPVLANAWQRPPA